MSTGVNRALVDTSYLLALAFKRDQHHQAAIQHWQHAATSSRQLVTTSFILAEAVTFLNSRGYHTEAVELGNNLLYGGPAMQFIHVDADLLLEGWSYFQQHNDKDYSLADCISFVVMQRLGLNTAFTFDKHFAQAGFLVEP
jgi:predicted nucleic acid-binding protein